MKQVILVTTLYSLFSFNAVAQTDTVQKAPVAAVPGNSDDEDKVFTKVENEAYFKGGYSEWIKFLQKKLGSFDASKNGAPKGMYHVIIRFIVNKKGKISSVYAESHEGFGMEEAAIRTIKESPDWEPALQNTRPVNAYRRQPFTFVVE